MRVLLGKSPQGEERWADLVDPDEMSQGIRFRTQELLQLFKDPDAHAFLVSMKMRAKLIAEVVTEWSLDLPLPKGDPELLSEVPGLAYDKLVEATEEHSERLDFIQAGRTSSESKTESKGTSSRARTPRAKP